MKQRKTATKVAKLLLKIKAVKLNPEKPFKWSSGRYSPIYCDNRKNLSNVKERTFIKKALVKAIKKHFPSVKMIAGVATAGIAQGAMAADQLKLPYVYVRPEKKDHGTGRQIEGIEKIRKGTKVVLIEDLVSTAKSSLGAVKALRNDGANVIGVVAIFTYGFEEAQKAFEEADVKLITLSNYSTLLLTAVKSKYITGEKKLLLETWSQDAKKWSDDFEKQVKQGQEKN